MWRATVASILSILQQISTMKELRQTQALITKTGLTGYTPVIAKLITFSALSTSGSLEYARAIFNETTVEDSFICNTMLRAYSKSAFPVQAIFIYNQMQRMNIETDHFTYPFVLKACARVFSRGEEDDKLYGFRICVKGGEIHCRALQTGFVCDHFVQNSLINMYSHCGFLDLGRRVFDEMEEKTVASWNTMIAAYDRVNDFESADLMMQSIPGKNVISWNTLIARYVKLCNMKAARRIFEEMPEKDAVSWNSMIAGYVQSKDYNGALELFREMQACGVEATEVTLISVLGACAEMGALDFGEELHELLKRKEFKIEGFLGTALLDMYAKCGSLNLAWEVFNGMKMKHVSSWNSMIVALAVHGYCKEALALFSDMEMRIDEVRPNHITFIGVLIACSHKGLVEEGRQYFARMIGEYKIRPDIKHYGCMVDLLSRCGLLDEAYHIVKTIPFGANCVLWRTLLAACGNYGHVELAEEAFRRLSKLDPLKDGDWVLLSNIYAEAERWADVERMRSEMIGLGILKKPGLSQIEVHIVFRGALPKEEYSHSSQHLRMLEVIENGNPEVNILKSEAVNDSYAPTVASFSSRGPNYITPDILKPDVSAPGVEILAAYPPVAQPSRSVLDKRSVQYNILSGTSMACPHAAGAAAYVKSFHPHWTPSAIKSALMTTAWPMNATKNPEAEFAYGAGHIDPVKAVNPGLVYESLKDDYIKFLCNIGYDTKAVRTISGDNSSCPQRAKGEAKDLNLPSLTVHLQPDTPFLSKFSRTAKNVGSANSTYKASVTSSSKIKINVIPSVLSFKSLSEEKSFVVTVSGDGFPINSMACASLEWNDGTHSVRSPIVVHSFKTIYASK